MKTSAPQILVLAIYSIALCGTAAAQTPPAALVPCTRMAEPGERLRCYDEQMTAMGASVAGIPKASTGTVPSAPITGNSVASGSVPQPAPAPPPPVPPSAAAPAAAPPAPAPDAKFGADDLKQSARPKETETDKVLLSTIKSIREARPKLWIIVLANGQIWIQEGTQITSFFRVGYDVRIEKGLLGAYRMATVQTGEKNMVRVTRIQ